MGVDRGEPTLNAAPSDVHQWIVRNVVAALIMREREFNAPWAVLPGLGVHISEKDRPEPDVLVIPSEKRDLSWKRKVYASLSSLTHYIVISQDAVDVMVFARDDAFEGRRFRSLDEAIDLPSLGVSLPMAEIYRDTGLT